MAKLKDVAEEAGVSIRTVARVLKGEEHIKADKKAKVEEALKKLHYIPNVLARSLKTNKSNMIGIITHSLNLPVNVKKLASLQKSALEKKLRTTIGFTEGDQEREKQYILEYSQLCDGLIFFQHPHPENLSLTKDLKIPFLYIDSKHPNVTTISIDRKQGILEALESQASKFKNKLFVTLTENDEERWDSFNEFNTGQKKRIALPDLDSFTRSKVPSSIKANLLPSTLAVCYNDRIAAHLYRWALEAKLSIPNDFAIVGFDDDNFTQLLPQALSSISQSTAELADIAIEAILDLIAGKEVKEGLKVSTFFIPRETTLN